MFRTFVQCLPGARVYVMRRPRDRPRRAAWAAWSVWSGPSGGPGKMVDKPRRGTPHGRGTRQTESVIDAGRSWRNGEQCRIAPAGVRATSRVEVTTTGPAGPRLEESHMADTVKITAEKRTEFGKGAARRVRRAHKIPAVLYGHGTDPVHLTLPGHDTMLAVKVANAVLSLSIDGKEQLALVKDVQRDMLKPVIEHIDLVVVRRGEKVVVDVAVTTTGEAAPETLVNVESQTIQVQAEATHIPTGFEVSVEGLAAGTQILASQIELPRGVDLVTEPDTLVVNVTQAVSAEALEAELAEAEAEAGIEKEEAGAEGEAAEAPAEGAEGSTEA